MDIFLTNTKYHRFLQLKEHTYWHTATRIQKCYYVSLLMNITKINSVQHKFCYSGNAHTQLKLVFISWEFVTKDTILIFKFQKSVKQTELVCHMDWYGLWNQNLSQNIEMIATCYLWKSHIYSDLEVRYGNGATMCCWLGLEKLCQVLLTKLKIHSPSQSLETK
jgi:hypothetical protein